MLCLCVYGGRGVGSESNRREREQRDYHGTTATAGNDSRSPVDLGWCAKCGEVV